MDMFSPESMPSARLGEVEEVGVGARQHRRLLRPSHGFKTKTRTIAASLLSEMSLVTMITAPLSGEPASKLKPVPTSCDPLKFDHVRRRLRTQGFTCSTVTAESTRSWST